MTDVHLAAGSPHRVMRWSVRLAFLLMVVSAVLLAAIPLGFRLGLLATYSVGFSLFPYAAYAAIAAMAVAAIVMIGASRLGGGVLIVMALLLVLGSLVLFLPMHYAWARNALSVFPLHDVAYAGVALMALGALVLVAASHLSLGGRLAALLALGGAAAVFWVPSHFIAIRDTLPRIHDITTDTQNPPPFIAVLAARAAEKAGPADYAEEIQVWHQRVKSLDMDIPEAQKKYFPDVVPYMTTLAPAPAFAFALKTAEGMPGWTIVDKNPTTGRIEATQKSLWMGFTDDIVVRVSPDGAGSRIDIRSESRQGLHDFGANVKRVRAYLAALKQG